MIYLDTSAFPKLYLREESSEFVQRCIETQDQPIPVVDVLEWEFANALRLKVFWKELDAGTVEHLLALFDDRLKRGQYATAELDAPRRSQDLRNISRHSQTYGSRTLDLVHVASAVQLQPEYFLSFDERQRAVATAVGLSVLPVA
ncbi:MAG: type II toxin-antitoxin system VapC family toxin [Spirochaeta sp.]|nr:type II toxin-antitoxin system VapC family toxin [Spirochaeta sp.]